MTTTASRVFRLPDLGEGLTEAALVQWLVQVGDVIATDQPIAEVETAKSVVELPSPFAGTVSALHGEEGSTIDVGSPVLEVQGQDSIGAPSGDEKASSEPVELSAYRDEERAGSGNVLIGYGTKAPSGRGRRRARVTAAATPPPSVASPTPPAPPTPTTRTAVRSPIVRRLARDLGLDLALIVATGADGAVTRADVLRAAADNSVDGFSAAPLPAGAPDELSVVRREPMSMLRKAVSTRLSRSRREIPEATVWVDVDVTDLWRLRPQMARAGERPPSFTAILARYTLLALNSYPLLATRLSEDGSEIIEFDGINLGFAADTPRGLLVPVITRAERLPIGDLDAELRELAEQARDGALPPERLRGSTFTLNNYGGFGVDGSAAIINHPEVAILGVGRILERPWVVDGEIVARRIAQLSLVFDHRVCDGGYAAGFLRQVVDALEHPLTEYARV